MIIGVTGATSGVGSAVIAQVARSGNTAVRLERVSRSPTSRHYDLNASVSPALLDGLDAVVHLAWQWHTTSGAARDPNTLGGERLAQACAIAGTRPVLLSTFSAFAASTSAYGAAQVAVEHSFREAGGTALRAGLVWGGTPSGMAVTLTRLAQLPQIYPHLSPDPALRHSEVAVLAAKLVNAAHDGDRVISRAASDERVRLSAIFHAARGRRSRAHLRVPVPALLLVARSAERLKLNLPFCSVSLASLSESVNDISTPGMQSVGDFPGNADFLRWLTRHGRTRGG